VAKSVLTYRRLASGVAIRSLTDIRWIITRPRYASLEHRRELLESDLSGTNGAACRNASGPDGLCRVGAGGHARHGHDDGEGACRVRPGGVRTVQRRASIKGRLEARGSRLAAPSPGRVVSRAGDGDELGRGARGG